VVCSLSDNYPNTVLECVGAGIPLLTTNVGGIPEIIDARDRPAVCFEPRASVLAKRFQTALDEGAHTARPAALFGDIENQWVSWHSFFRMALRAMDMPLRSNEAAGI
jgi:glycosyltransferase involved in cell wall biosynthesis